ncbi:3-keto-disaccharide hydrolase [Pedobacter sp. AW31-3R]|uniref:3-keto-disaccharide hydrolase n=1 Tax=Pedobacter sp. AW31-3R TaxID=3445781 RepID=UPI003FA059CE
MKVYSILALSFLSIMGYQSTKGQDKGFVALFDGKTTKGWHTYGQTFAGKGWKAEKGVLHLDPKARQNDAGDLVTDKEYDNFHLKIDWKVAPKANSAILFHIQEDTAKYHQTYSTGPEMQVLDNEGHPDGKIIKHRAGDLYDLVKSSSEPVKPVGEWNTAEIISNNGLLEFILNGVKIVSTSQFDDSWKALIAGSKFAAWQGFGVFPKGKISLQDHGDEVWFRNIMIKDLNKNK